jgi:hypothetical protein
MVTLKDGRESCAEYGQEAYEVQVDIRGQLTVQPGTPR